VSTTIFFAFLCVIDCTKKKQRAKLMSIRSPTPAKTVQSHIRLLHDYNEIRDVGQGLLGLIADRRGVRYGDVLGEFGVDADD
jgi:DNA repair protein Swi5/Sae3